ncbi:hypothetical protein [Sulfitobacter aestuariivivens]|uniref:hypothetical protein n=1 Tax=Sulfitobacter aestuariivivens TaxID=2766981 RepID=UPI001FE2EAEA|nr:hypothetical protein [Sulfitobacter aestuariivivens]
MIRVLLLCFGLLAACNTPGPHFRGLPATRVMVDGSTFDVRVRNNLAEAMRINMQYAPRFGPIRARAASAMAQVSGCEVTEVRGDQALAIGLLDCGNGPPRVPRHRRQAGPLDCIPVRGSGVEGFGEVTVELECY